MVPKWFSLYSLASLSVITGHLLKSNEFIFYGSDSIGSLDWGDVRMRFEMS